MKGGRSDSKPGHVSRQFLCPRALLFLKKVPEASIPNKTLLAVLGFRQQPTTSLRFLISLTFLVSCRPSQNRPSILFFPHPTCPQTPCARPPAFNSPAALGKKKKIPVKSLTPFPLRPKHVSSPFFFSRRSPATDAFFTSRPAPGPLHGFFFLHPSPVIEISSRRALHERLMLAPVSCSLRSLRQWYVSREREGTRADATSTASPGPPILLPEPLSPSPTFVRPTHTP